MLDLETRMRMLEDRFAISELRSKYGWYTARGMKAEVISLFEEEGVFENFRTADGAPSVASGRRQLEEYFARMAPGRRLPMVTNEVLQIDGDAAHGTCVMVSVGDEPFCGHYIDAFVRLDGFWLFRKRSFYPYWPVFAPNLERRSP